MKKFLSLIMSAAVIFTCIGSSVISQATEYDGDLYSFETEDGSEYGYSPYKVVNEWGEEVEFGTNPEYYVPDSSCLTTMSLVPETYDAREEGHVTPVKYQGIAANCWIFATVSALESDSIVNAGAEAPDFSEAHFSWFASRGLAKDTQDPTYGDGVDVESPYRKGGNWVIATSALARWTGMANEIDYPFNPNDLSVMGNYSESSRYDVSSGTVLNSAEMLLDADDIKQWVCDHGSAVMSYYHDDKCYNENTTSYYYSSTPKTNHQVTIVGWDDNYSAENFNNTPEGNGAWLCKNSWSMYWGMGGYFWVSYYDTSISNIIGFSSKTVDENDNNYNYNGAGYSSFYNSKNKIKTANVFTAENCEKLTSIATYTISEGTTVKVSVYTNLNSDYTKPVDGTLASTSEMYIVRPGYHTIELSQPVDLAPGTIFSVVVEAISPEGNRVVPFERSGVSEKNYSSNPRESFITLTGRDTSWKDMQTMGYDNAMIQAFTETCHSIVTDIEEATCEKGGYERTYCELCGETVNEIKTASSGHLYGEWTEYQEGANGEMKSSRECVHCGRVEYKSYTKGNVVSFQNFMAMFFERLFEMFKFSF